MTNEEFQEHVNTAVLSGDPGLAQLALDAVEEEFGPDAAENVAQNVHDLYAEQHGPQMAASYVAALGYTVEDPDDGELVVSVDENGDLVISEEDAAALEEALGRELEAGDLEAFLDADEDDGFEAEDPRTMELEERLAAAEWRLQQEPAPRAASHHDGSQPTYEYEPTDQERQEQQADRIENVVDELELGINRQLSDRELTEVATALLNNSEAELDKVHLHDVDGSHHQRVQWMAERMGDLERVHAEEQAEQPDTAQTWDDPLTTDEHDAMSEHERRAIRVSEMNTAIQAGSDPYE